MFLYTVCLLVVLFLFQMAMVTLFALLFLQDWLVELYQETVTMETLRKEHWSLDLLCTVDYKACHMSMSLVASDKKWLKCFQLCFRDTKNSCWHLRGCHQVWETDKNRKPTYPDIWWGDWQRQTLWRSQHYQGNGTFCSWNPQRVSGSVQDCRPARQEGDGGIHASGLTEYFL